MAKFTIIVLLLTVKTIKSVRPEAHESIGSPSDKKLAFIEMQLGPFKVDKLLNVYVDNPGSQCSKTDGYLNLANIYYPKDAKDKGPFPVVSHAHAFTVGGNSLHAIQGPRLFELIASEGFIVITHQSAEKTLCDTSIDQLNMIRYLYSSQITPELIGLVKQEAYVTGWSMGGRATLQSASRAINNNGRHIENLKINGAVAIAPYCQSSSCKTPAITTFFISGGQDQTSRDADIFKVYKSMTAPASKKHFGNMDHNPPPNVFERDIAEHVKNALKCMAAKGSCEGYFDAACVACDKNCYQKGCAQCGGRNPDPNKCTKDPCPFCKSCQWGGCMPPLGCTWCNTNL